jgi:hypothetical protein
VFNSSLNIWRSSDPEEAKIFPLKTLPYSIPICVTFAFPELMGLEAKKIS